MKIKKMILAVISTALLLTGCSTVKGTIQNPVTDASATTQTQTSTKHDLTVDFIDVGQGDSALLRSDGKAMLIDTGTPDSGTAIRLFLKKQGVTKLDYLVLTHPDADHIGGAASIITNVPIDHVFMPDFKKDNKTYNGVMDAIKYKYLKTEAPTAGDTFTFGNCDVKVLGPIKKYDDPNNNSIVLKVICGDNKFMFVGDAEEDELSDIVSKFGNELDADVYKVGHHGSHNSSTDGLVKKMTPDYSVISCGEGNSYGHPHAEALTRLRQSGSHLLRTDVQGTITIKSDGSKISCDPSPCDDWTSGESTRNSQTVQTEKKTAVVPASSDSNTGNTKYVLNTNSKKFHLPTCESVSKMSQKNRKDSTESRDKLIAQGYSPCKQCNP